MNTILEKICGKNKKLNLGLPSSKMADSGNYFILRYNFFWGHEIKKWSKSTFFDLWILTKNFIKFFSPLYIYIYIYMIFFSTKNEKKLSKKLVPSPL